MTDSLPPTGSTRPPSRREDAEAVVHRLRDAGHVAYFAGGCVRDELLGLTPKDYDVATDAPPPRVRKLFNNTQAVGAAFGVILVRWGKSQIEVATFRAEGAYLDGRRPSEVTFTTAEQDARRRDFTINGLFYDPVDMKVIDYVGGQGDLRAKVLRAIGEPNHRFEEDHLRLLRAIRFAARFGLTIDPNTADAIRRHAEQLKRISPERIAEELRLMFLGPDADAPWAWHALHVEFPALAAAIFRFSGVSPAPGTGTEPAILHVVAPVSGEHRSFGLCLAAISLEWSILSEPSGGVRQDVRNYVRPDQVRRMVRALRHSLKISNEESDEMEQTMLGVGILLAKAPVPPDVVTAKRFLARPTNRLSRILLDALKCYAGATVVNDIQRVLDAYAATDFAPPPLVTGDDLIAQGLQPGRLFKRLLDEVYDAQLEDRVKTREEALALAMRLANSPPPPAED